MTFTIFFIFHLKTCGVLGTFEKNTQLEVLQDKHCVIFTPEGLLVYFDSLHPCQQFFSQVRRCLPGLSTKQGIKLYFLIILTLSLLVVTFVVC